MREFLEWINSDPRLIKWWDSLPADKIYRTGLFNLRKSWRPTPGRPHPIVNDFRFVLPPEKKGPSFILEAEPEKKPEKPATGSGEGKGEGFWLDVWNHADIIFSPMNFVRSYKTNKYWKGYLKKTYYYFKDYPDRFRFKDGEIWHSVFIETFLRNDQFYFNDEARSTPKKWLKKKFENSSYKRPDFPTESSDQMDLL